MDRFAHKRGKLVPLPSDALVPERDLNSSPILEARHLGIEFGGLKAVDDFNLTKVMIFMIRFRIYNDGF